MSPVPTAPAQLPARRETRAPADQLHRLGRQIAEPEIPIGIRQPIGFEFAVSTEQTRGRAGSNLQAGNGAACCFVDDATFNHLAALEFENGHWAAESRLAARINHFHLRRDGAGRDDRLTCLGETNLDASRFAALFQLCQVNDQVVDRRIQSAGNDMRSAVACELPSEDDDPPDCLR